MSSAIAILEHLLDDQSINSKEHIIETASPRLSNVEARLHQTFEQTVQEISTIWGDPQFNNRPLSDADDKVNNVVPTWSKGTARSGGEVTLMRLSYWKRPETTCYLALRAEIDTRKEPPRPLHYDLILGSRRRKPDQTKSVQNLRHNESSWLDGLKSGANGLVKWLAGR